MKKSVQKVESVPLEKIAETFYVRLALDENHVIHLASLLENGVELPPILLNEETHELVDGRHRKAAHELRGSKEIPSTFRKFRDRAEMILAALQSNTGGPLPPNNQDITHAVELLLGQKLSGKDVIGMVFRETGLPKLLIRRFVNDVRSQMFRRRLSAAVQAVVDGKTVMSAAAENDVPLEKLQAALGKKKETTSLNGDHFASHLSQRFGKFNRSMAQALLDVAGAVKDGVITDQTTVEIVSQLKKLSNRQRLMFEGWIKRLGGQVDSEGPSGSPKTDPAGKVSKAKNTGSRALDTILKS